MNEFRLDSNVKICGEPGTEPVRRAIDRFYRDMGMTLEQKPDMDLAAGGIILLVSSLASSPASSPADRVGFAEEYRIQVVDPSKLVIEAGGDLGFIYALHFLSQEFLGVQPFWFWNDQAFVKKAEVLVPASEYRSKQMAVRYRGWFINDEVLISHWDGGKDAEYPWEMAFEALLRCGGNVVIPGTDQNSKRYAGLASAMGLWITHHHAEPLGAEMFLRAYPDKNPSFQENPHLFRELWEEGVERQKEDKVIWNLGFRGQGDTPFWETDPRYDTPEKRGKLISDIMQEQYELVKKYVKDPVCCTNLYGETMELYQQGYLRLPENVIMIWADNGYGKMVSRRQGNHNPRVVALPGESLRKYPHGVYYHVSFYDLQAANVLTMLPNSMEFVDKELKNAYECGITDLWLVNCSNIKPHVYPLDFISAMWQNLEVTPMEHLTGYLKTYYMRTDLLEPCCFDGRASMAEKRDDCLLKMMETCFQDYFKCMIPYGQREDEHAGEQFYNYVVRVLIYGWMRDGGNRHCEELEWCVAAETFDQQMQWYHDVCEGGYDRTAEFRKRCEALEVQAGSLWKDSILLQARIHSGCLAGALQFTKAYQKYKKGQYLDAFFELGQAADQYQAVDDEMKRCGHDKWSGFYDNDCQSDVKQTAYLLRNLMGYVRNIGDGPYYYQWQRQVIYPEKDRNILLLLNEENHLTDEALYQALISKRPASL